MWTELRMGSLSVYVTSLDRLQLHLWCTVTVKFDAFTSSCHEYLQPVVPALLCGSGCVKLLELICRSDIHCACT